VCAENFADIISSLLVLGLEVVGETRSEGGCGEVNHDEEALVTLDHLIFLEDLVGELGPEAVAFLAPDHVTLGGHWERSQ